MKNTLKTVATLLQDLFYREFRKNTDFLRMVHFKFLIANAYAALLQEEYVKSYRNNLLVHGHGFADISSDWLVEDQIEVDLQGKQLFAKLNQPYFSFLYDQSGIGIYSIRPTGEGVGVIDLLRIHPEEEYKYKYVPFAPNVVYFFPLKDKVVFLGDTTKGVKFQLLFIPSLATLEDSLQVPMALNEEVIKRAFNVLMAAKSGTPIVDKTADGNPNAVLATEINERAAAIQP